MRKIALRLGWEQVAPLQTFVLLLRPRRVLRDKLNAPMAGLAGFGLTLRQHGKRIMAGPGHRLEVRPLDRFDARHDRLWNSVKHEYECAVVRDASYLNWKYVTQPGQDFIRLEFMRDGEVVAVAVLAVDAPGAIYRYSRAFVVELVIAGSDSELVQGVLESIRSRCASMEVDALFFHVLNEKLEKSLKAYGFMQREPTRFLLVRSQQTSGDLRRRLLSPGSWLITMGDSDIDRPWEIDRDRVQIRTARR
jgi:hypothetical protein